MPKTISYDQLCKAEACNGQLLLFSKIFGEEVTVSHDLIPQAMELGFELEWAANKLLTQSARESYVAARASIMAALNETMEPAVAVFNETLAQANAVLNEALPQADAAFNETLAQAMAAFNETMKPANAAYDEATAHAFVDAYLAS